jgi:hypothetical protein
VSPSVCTASGNTVTLLTTGTCSVQASQAGNSTYAAATPVIQGFTVQSPPTPTADAGDVPLPPWAYAALASLLSGGMAWQRRRMGGLQS